MNSDTPETDAASIPTAKWKETPVCGSFARKLERERDGARHDRDLYHETANREHAERVKAEAERDQLRKVCDSLALAAECFVAKVDRGMARSKNSYASFKCVLESYNQLPHVKDKAK